MAENSRGQTTRARPRSPPRERESTKRVLPQLVRRGCADGLRVRGGSRHGALALCPAGTSGGTVRRAHRRAATAARGGERPDSVVRVRHSRPRLRHRRPRAARRPPAQPGHRRPARLRGDPARSPSRRARGGRHRPDRPPPGGGRQQRRWVLVRFRRRPQPRSRLRALCRSDPGRGDHGVGLPVVHGRAAGGGALLRGRQRAGAVRADARRAAAHRPAGSQRGPLPDGDGRGDGGRGRTDAGRLRHALPDGHRRRPPRLSR